MEFIVSMGKGGHRFPDKWTHAMVLVSMVADPRACTPWTHRIDPAHHSGNIICWKLGVGAHALSLE